MWYLFLEIWFGLLVAFLLGWFGHWFCSSRGTKEEMPSSDPAENADAP
jgi:hypothetical protein